MLWLALHLPQLALDLARHAAPAETRALAISAGAAQRLWVYAANAEARALGVQAGQKLTAAQAICPDLRIVRRSRVREHQALGQLAACLYRISAEVSVGGGADDRVDGNAAVATGIVLEVAASRRLFAGGVGIVAAVRAVLVELDMGAQIGIAPTPAAAELAARFADGTQVLSRQALLRLLDTAPLALAALSADSQALLAGSGLQRIGEVLRLPRPALARRIGAADLCRLDQLTGARADCRVLYQPPRRFARSLEMPAPLTDTQSLWFPLQRLLRDLGLFLAASDRGIQQFEVIFSHVGQAPSRMSVGLLQVERDAAVLFELAKERLARQSLPGATLALAVCAETLLPFAPMQTDLLSPSTTVGDCPERLLERLRARLGDAAICGLGRIDEHRPELASAALAGQHLLDQRCPAADESRDGRGRPRRELAADESRDGRGRPRRELAAGESMDGRGRPRRELAAGPPVLSPRPNWLLATPQPINVDGLHWHSGPERIESGWWDGGDCRRDYFVATDSKGRRVWVFRTLGKGADWYLHGVFG